MPACLPHRRGAPLGPRQARLRARGAGVRLHDRDRVLREVRRCRRRDPQAAGALARRLRLLAGPAAGGRLVRRLPAVPGGVSGGRRLLRPPRGEPEGGAGEDRGEGVQGRGVQGGAAGRRRHSRARRVERALGRAGGLPGHRRTPAPGVPGRAGAARGRRPRPPRRRSSGLGRGLQDAADRGRDQGQGARARGGPRRHRRRRRLRRRPAAGRRQHEARRHHRARRRARHRAGQALYRRHHAHRALGRPPQVLQRRADPDPAGGGLARAGVLARGQGLSGADRPADPTPIPGATTSGIRGGT